ncbi:MAG: SgcJ/EcaC family oxidoreductase [Acidobacteria bacterium]|nr:SgcJ/EcaC family oxidoreductase [Acidobacteriota bacterium]
MNHSATHDAGFDEMIQDYLQAFNDGDFKRVASYWAEDGVHQPPMGPEVRGREALEEFYRQSFEVVNARISDYSNEYRIVGDHVFVRESFTATIQPPGEEPVSLPGRGLWIGRKEEDGIWRSFWALARIDQPEGQPDPT